MTNPEKVSLRYGMTATYLPRLCPTCRVRPPEPGQRRCHPCATPRRHRKNTPNTEGTPDA
jgi:hypothetical protein